MMPSRSDEEEALRAAQSAQPKRRFPGSRQELLEDELYQAKFGLTAKDRRTAAQSFISDAISHIDRKVPADEEEKWKALAASIEEDVQKTMEQVPFTSEAMLNADNEQVNEVASGVSGASSHSHIREPHIAEYWNRIENHVEEIRWGKLVKWVDKLAGICTTLKIFREQRLERSPEMAVESYRSHSWSSDEDDGEDEAEDEDDEEKEG